MFKSLLSYKRIPARAKFDISVITISGWSRLKYYNNRAFINFLYSCNGTSPVTVRMSQWNTRQEFYRILPTRLNSTKFCQLDWILTNFTNSIKFCQILPTQLNFNKFCLLNWILPNFINLIKFWQILAKSN